MSIHRSAAVLVLLLLIFTAAVAAETPRCAECGMMVVENSRFTARILDGKATLGFCDIGDLLTYLRDKKRPAAGAQVRDHASGEWIDAASAFFVHAPKSFTTPMGWGVAAFREKEKAQAYGAPLDLAAMTAALK